MRFIFICILKLDTNVRNIYKLHRKVTLIIVFIEGNSISKRKILIFECLIVKNVINGRLMGGL